MDYSCGRAPACAQVAETTRSSIIPIQLFLQTKTSSRRAPNINAGPAGGSVCLLAMGLVVATLLVSVTGDHVVASSIMRVDRMDKTILPPLVNNYTNSPHEVTLVIVAEQGIKHAAYAKLGMELQSQCPMKLWVVLINFTKSLFNRLKECDGHLKRLGRKKKNVFLAGHGEGGLEVQLLAHARAEILSGVILLGSYLRKWISYTEFPVPILTIVGDLDGVTRITRIAEAFRVLSKEANGDIEMLTRSPMVVMEGANHGSFSDDILTDSMMALDIPPELTVEEARKQITEYIRIFLSYNTEISYTEMAAQERSMKQWYEITQRSLQPLLSMSNTEVGENYTSRWVSTLQMWLSGLEGKDTQRLQVASFVSDKYHNLDPDLHILEDSGHQPMVLVYTFLQLVQQDNRGDDNGALPQSPREIKARMLSAKRILAHLKNATAVRFFTCKDLNYAAFVTALAMASNKALERYYARHLGAIFHEDIVVDTLIEWEQSELRVESVLHEQHVTSFVYRTDTEAINGKVKEGEAGGGLYFCRLLPPTRVLEWLYVDSLQTRLHRMKRTPHESH